MKSYALIFMLAAAVATLCHRGLDRFGATHPVTLKETLPSAEALRLLSLGYKSLVADYYWLRAVYEFGDADLSNAKYPNLAALIERVVALDPYYLTAYAFAGTALTVPELDPKLSIDILRRGLVYRPDSWQLPFLLGFNLYYFEHDYAEAARALAKAAVLTDAPGYVGPLATRLAAEAGRPEIGLELVSSMLTTIVDEKLRAVYEERQRLLQLEVQINWLQEAIDRYTQERNQHPTHLEDLTRAGMLPFVPADPLGGHYFIDAAGKIVTTSENKRLRLPTQVGDTRP